MTGKRTAMAFMFATAAALVAWGGFAWMAYQTRATVQKVEETALEKESVSRRHAFASTLHTLARDTSVEREKIGQYIAGRNAVQVIQVLRDAGQTAGVRTSVDSVGSAPIQGKESSLEKLIVTVRAEGSFRALFHFLALLETIPLGVRMEQVALENEEDFWVLLVQIQMLQEAEAQRE